MAVKRTNRRTGSRISAYKRRQRSRRRMQMLIRIGLAVMICLTLFLIIRSFIGKDKVNLNQISSLRSGKSEFTIDDLDVQLLTQNPYSRPGTAMENVNGIVIHYTANPGTSAQNNRDYFEGLKDSGITQVSSHFVVGMEGEVIQCIPTAEIAYASNDRNGDTIAIECCHPDESGVFTDATYNSLVELVVFLCQKFNLDETAVMRHYDITGKACPKYYVDNETEWYVLLDDIKKRL